MQPLARTTCAACCAALAFTLSASAQCDPGPPTGSDVNRCYDDGYVRVDSAGNVGGLTWYWGYDTSSQLQNGSLVFHSRTALGGNLTQVLSDTYSLGALPAPEAPYSGTFTGPGPLIPAAPASRSIEVVPEPTAVVWVTLGMLALLGHFARTRRRTR